MAAAVSRDWRKKKPGTHTREVHSEHLPEGLRAAVLALVDRVEKAETSLAEAMQTISELQLKLVDTESRLLNAEAFIRALDEHAAKKLGEAA